MGTPGLTRETEPTPGGSSLSFPPERRQRKREKYPGLFLSSHWPNFAGSHLAMGMKRMQRRGKEGNGSEEKRPSTNQ